MPNTTRCSLVAALKDPDDKAAWGTFAGRYGQVIRTWCLERCRALGFPDADHSADEVAAEVVANIHAKMRSYDPKAHRTGGYRKWLRTVALNALTDYLRSGNRYRGTGDTSVLNLLDRQPDRDALGDAVEREYQRELLHGVVLPRVQQEFTDIQWRAVEALGLADGRAGAGRPAAEVAAEFGYTPGSLFQLKRRVLQRIRDVLDESQQDDNP